MKLPQQVAGNYQVKVVNTLSFQIDGGITAFGQGRRVFRTAQSPLLK